MATRQTTQQWVYRVRSVTRVVDGDSFWLDLSLGFYLNAVEPVRLHSIDTPELNQGSPFERRQAKTARDFTAAWLSFALNSGAKLWVQTYKDPDNFGRWLGDVWWETGDNGEDLGTALMDASLATQYPTRWHHVYDPERNLP